MTMGTVYQVKFHGVSAGSDLVRLQHETEQHLAQINRQMSTYDPASEISRFNQHQEDTWFPVSAETALVVATALDISRKTDGAFDPTIGPLVNLWNFGPDRGSVQVPDDQDIEEAKQRVGYQYIESRLSPPALRKLRGSVCLDLSAIAKGFGVDVLAEMLSDRGAAGYMVEIGGEVRTKGVKPDGTVWRIGIEKPIRDGRAVHEVVALQDGSLATSGDYRNFFEMDGRRFSHEIDPRTGYPVDHDLASVSVITEQCMLADVWATALIVAGPAQAMRLAERNNLHVLLIERVDGGFQNQMSPEFASYLQSKDHRP
jgi:thiamine biosynthesis lipoprotein